MTAVAGLFGGGMIAVLIAKIVGVCAGCTADAETGAPCDWITYMRRGARASEWSSLPTLVIWRMRKARAASRNSE